MGLALDRQRTCVFRGSTYCRGGFTPRLLHLRPEQEQQTLGVTLAVGVEGLVGPVEGSAASAGRSAASSISASNPYNAASPERGGSKRRRR